MNKATPITIAGRVFYLEDDGFDRLRRYLESLRGFFSSQEGGDEIMTDIEARIAERFAELTAATRAEAIPVEELLALIEAIGRPEDFSEGIEPEGQGMRTRRRFFRDPVDGMLAGVCAGLGRYLNRDPNLVRVVFVLLTLVWGFGALLYSVLWLVIPGVHSSTDRLTMRGEPYNLASLTTLTSERPNTARRGLERLIAMPFTLLRRIAATMSTIILKIYRGVGPFIRSATGIAMVAVAVPFLAGITLLMLVALANLPENFLDPTLMTFFQEAPRRSLAFFSWLALMLPGLFVLYGGATLLGRRSAVQPNLLTGLVGLWFVAAVVAGTLWVRTAMRFEAFQSAHPDYQPGEMVIHPPALAFFEQDLDWARVRIVEGPRNEVRITGRNKELERVTYTLTGERMRVSTAPDAVPCVVCDLRGVNITIASPTPDSIDTSVTGYVTRDYEAARVRRETERQARADSIQAERQLREARARELQDSLVTLRLSQQARIETLQDSLAALRR